MIFRRPIAGTLELRMPIVERLKSFQQLSARAPEAGGILLGRWLVSEGHVIVDEITEPSQADRRSRFSFFRARKPAQQRVNQVWSESNRTSQYLGEWHTHPEERPTPSAIDLDNWRSILLRTVFESESLFFVIVGQAHVCVWEGTKQPVQIIQLMVAHP